MKEYKVEGHASSFLPEGKEWKMIWNDEFDGKELDKTKWDFRTHMMGKRHRTWVADEGIELDGNSNVIFKCIEKDGEICSCQLQTGYNYMDAPHKDDGDCWGGGLVWPIGKFKKHKFVHGHGYYECRCKLQKKEGWWSAFWLQSPIIGSSLNPAKSGIEIDIMESFEPNQIAPHFIHWSGYGKDHRCAQITKLPLVEGTGDRRAIPETDDGWHTFAVDWSEDGYTFYIDGKFDGHIASPVSHTEQFILISTEVQGYRHAAHRPTQAAYDAIGDEFIVDYVRVYNKVN